MKHDFYRLNKQYKLIAIRNLTAYKSINEHNLIYSVHFRKTTFFRCYLEIHVQELGMKKAMEDHVLLAWKCFLYRELSIYEKRIKILS